MNLEWRAWTRGQWVARAIVLIAPLAALYARTPALGTPLPWLAVLVLLLSAGWALAPESFMGAVALLVVGLSWADGRAGGMPAAALLAAAAMLTAHLTALVISYGPQRLPVEPAVVRLWALRGLVVLAAAPAVWVVGRLVGELPASGTIWVLGLAVAVSVVVVAVAVTQALMPDADVD